ncbi:MAG: restriction endonuclease [Candidatus Paceibacterota bacterium]|jgi:hypothetical protein
MSLTLKQSQIFSQLADLLYGFLPGTPHPFADPGISFGGVASQLNLGKYWQGGSKLPAIQSLLENVYLYDNAKFCDLILIIVTKGIAYKYRKKDQITRENIEKLNELIKILGFKIPDLRDPQFLDTLPSSQVAPNASPVKTEENLSEKIRDLDKEFIRISSLQVNQRGFEFEKFLHKLFESYGFNPRPSFRLVGEQIDGSLDFDGSTYLIEARWRNQQAAFADLLTLQGKVERKAQWSRGIFISMSGFTSDGLQAFIKGSRTSIIGITGQDIYLVLNQQKNLKDLIRFRVRRAAETGEIISSVYDL